MKMKRLFYIVIILFLSSAVSRVYSQEYNIVPLLKEIEKGNQQEVEKLVVKLLSERPNDPSIIFLDAVLTTDGNSALSKYQNVYGKYPKSKYADAALYRIFSYYYSLGYYKRAEEFLKKLQNEFPQSPYIKAANRNIPDDEEIYSEPVTSSVVQEPVVTDNFNFTVQAGAFMNVQNAKNLKNKFEGDGYPSEINTKEVGGSILNVVTVGKFKTANDASSLLEHLKSKYNLNGRVIPFNK